MSAAYKLIIKNSVVGTFDHLLLASKGSFADSIHIQNSQFRNAKNGFVLAADQKEIIMQKCLPSPNRLLKILIKT